MMADRNVFKEVNLIKLNKRIQDDNDCLEYIAQGWSDSYNCKRSNNAKFGPAKNIQNQEMYEI